MCNVCKCGAGCKCRKCTCKTKNACMKKKAPKKGRK